ncbi:hypothetical protein J6590_087676 [Homalodisca vitripennis]|nr:hypothetical protein J6590_087676 [Homalodisca vitripennis]
MAVFDNEIERWGEVDVPYLPSQLIGTMRLETRERLSRYNFPSFPGALFPPRLFYMSVLLHYPVDY